MLYESVIVLGMEMKDFKTIIFTTDILLTVEVSCRKLMKLEMYW